MHTAFYFRGAALGQLQTSSIKINGFKYNIHPIKKLNPHTTGALKWHFPSQIIYQIIERDAEWRNSCTPRAGKKRQRVEERNWIGEKLL